MATLLLISILFPAARTRIRIINFSLSAFCVSIINRLILNVSYFEYIFRFVQSWSVRNNGEEAWPYGCYIKSTSNENLPMVPVEPIEPGQCTVISVNLRSPCELGSFQTKWRLFTSNGSCFGGKWPIIVFLSFPLLFSFPAGKYARSNALKGFTCEQYRDWTW